MVAPKPFVGYLTAAAHDLPKPQTKSSWVYGLSPLCYTVQDALNLCASPYGEELLKSGEIGLYKVTVTFEPLRPNGKPL